MIQVMVMINQPFYPLKPHQLQMDLNCLFLYFIQWKFNQWHDDFRLGVYSWQTWDCPPTEFELNFDATTENGYLLEGVICYFQLLQVISLKVAF